MRTILYLIRKEALQVFRDRIMVFQIFFPPILQLLILSQALIGAVVSSLDLG